MSSLIRNYFSEQTKLIAQSLLRRKSIQLITRNFYPDLLVDYVFNSYEFKKEHFGRYADDFVLIEADGLDVDDIREDVLTLVNIQLIEKSFIDFQSFDQLNNYLRDKEKTIVIYSTDRSQEMKLRIYSLKYYLGSNISFIFVDFNEEFNSDEFIFVHVNGDILEQIIIDRAEELGISIDTQKVLQKIQGDVDEIDNAIIKVLYEKVQGIDSQEPEILEHFVDEEPPVDAIQIIGEDDAAQVPQKEHVEKPTSEVTETISDESVLQNRQPHVVPPKEKKPKTGTVSPPVKNVQSDGTPKLTPRERDIYNILLERKFLTRDELADIVWGEEASIKANPDAIDQIISRLRRKFVHAGYDKSYIMSRKGEGIVLNET